MNVIKQLISRIDEAGMWEKTVHLKRNDFLSTRGSLNTNLYYVVSGSLRIYFEEEFEEQILRLGYRGNLIAALDTFLSDQPSDLYIQALKKCKLKVLSKSSFLAFLDADPANRSLWQTLLEQWLYQQMEREKDILISSPKERYERVLRRSPHLFQEVPARYIASYLRMAPETLSRLKKS